MVAPWTGKSFVLLADYRIEKKGTLVVVDLSKDQETAAALSRQLLLVHKLLART